MRAPLLRRFLAALLSAGIVPALPAQDLDALRALIRAQGVSGREAPVREVLQARLPPGRAAEVDNLGNLIVVLGSGRPQRLVLAGMDEAGFVVTQIRDDGYLRVRRPARSPLPPPFNAYFVGQPLLIGAAGDGDPIPALSAVLSTHLQRGRAGAVPQPLPRDEDLLVDAGARSESEARAAGIRLLAPVTLEKDLSVLGDGLVAGFGMDDRAGCEVLLELARSSALPAGKGSIVLAWAAQGWVDRRGAERLARRFEPDEVLVVDLYAAPAAGETVKQPSGRPGRGPFLADSPEKDAPSRDLRAAIRAKARALGIPLQRVDFPSSHQGKPFAGRPLAVLGVPVRYPGTPVEMVSRDDLDALVRLLGAHLGAER